MNSKVTDLLKKMNVTPELIEEFDKLLDETREGMKKQLEEQFRHRLGNAKKVCAEEIEKQKADLARKVEVFLEARINTISREAQKQAAIGESEATKTLRELKSLLEGVNSGSSPTDQAAIAELKELRTACHRLQEQNEKLGLKAERANKIAMQVLQRNRILESSKAKVPATPVAKPVTEAKGGEKGRLESLRKPSATPKTARAPIHETVAHPAKVAAVSESVSPEIAAIANTLDGDPAFIR